MTPNDRVDPNDANFSQLKEFDNAKSKVEQIPVAPTPNSDTQKNRKPLEMSMVGTGAALKNIHSGILPGLADRISQEMPNSAQVYSELVNLKSGISGIKDEFVRDVSPTIDTFKQTANKFLPKAERFIPKKYYDILKRLTTVESDQYRYNKEAEHESQIKATLDDTFEKQLVFEKMRDEVAATERFVDRKLSIKSTRDTLTLLESIRQSSKYQAAFTQTIYTGYLRKSIELKYRHLMVSRDTLETTKVLVDMLDKKLDAIRHNTGLPDIQKKQMLESLKEVLIGRSPQMWGSFMNGYGGKLLANIKSQVFDQSKMFIKQAASTASMAQMAADDSFDFEEYDEEGNVIPKEDPDIATSRSVGGMAGRWIGKRIGNSAAGRALQKIRPYADDIEGQAAYAKVRAIKGLEKYSRSGTVGGNLLSSILPTFNNDPSIQNTFSTNATAEVAFDVATRQSIVEVIPGFLGKILQSIDSLRTGEDEEEQVYDVHKRDFTTTSALTDDLTTRLLGSASRNQFRVTSAVSSVRAGYAHHGNKNLKSFDEVNIEISKVINNHALNKLLLEPESLQRFVQSEDGSFSNGYLKAILTSVKDPKTVIGFFIKSLYRTDGALNQNVVSKINTDIAGLMDDDGYLGELSKTVNGFGYKRHLGGLLDDRFKVNKAQVSDHFSKIDQDELTRNSAMYSAWAKQSLDENIKAKRDIHDNTKLFGFDIGAKVTPYLEKVFGKIDGGIDETVEMERNDISHTKTEVQRKAELAPTLIDAIRNRNKPIKKDVVTPSNISSFDFSNTENPVVATPQVGTTSQIQDTSDNTTKLVDITTDIHTLLEAWKTESASMLSQNMSIQYATLTDEQKADLSKFGEKRIGFLGHIGKGIGGALSGIGSFYKALGTIPLTITRKLVGGEYRGRYFDVYRADKREAGYPLLSKVQQIQGVVDSTTQRELHSTQDISGPVIDVITGDTLISEDDILAGLVDIYGKSIYGDNYGPSLLSRAADSVFRGTLGLAGSIIGGGMSLLGKTYGAMFGGAYKLLGKILAPNSRPDFFDIYLKGKVQPGNPLLSKQKQLKGLVQLVDKENNTYKELKKTLDIAGPVIDPETKETLVTEEDLKTGLVDVNGDELDSIKSNLLAKAGAGLITGVGKGLGAIGKGLGSVFGIYGKLFGLGIDAFKGLGKGAMGLLGNLLGLNNKTDDKALQRIVGDPLNRIYELLDQRLPKPVFGDQDGDGNREGSYQDYYQKRDAEGKEEEGASGALQKALGVGASAGKKGGLLGSLAGSIAGRLGIGAATGVAEGGLAAAAGTALRTAGVAAAGAVSGTAAGVAAEVAAVTAAGVGTWLYFKDPEEKTLKVLKERMNCYGIPPDTGGMFSRHHKNVINMEEQAVEVLSGKRRALTDAELSDTAAYFNFNIGTNTKQNKQERDIHSDSMGYFATKGSFGNTADKEVAEGDLETKYFIMWYKKRFIPILSMYVDILASYRPEDSDSRNIAYDQMTDRLPDAQVDPMLKDFHKQADPFASKVHTLTLDRAGFESFKKNLDASDKAGIKTEKMYSSISGINELTDEDKKATAKGDTVVSKDMKYSANEMNRAEAVIRSTSAATAIPQNSPLNTYKKDAATPEVKLKADGSPDLGIDFEKSMSAAQGTGGAYSEIPDSKGKGFSNNKDMLMAVAKAVGVSPQALVAFAGVESTFNPGLGSSASSAKGMFQFVDKTWEIMIGKYGSKYGIPTSTSPMDARANALMGAEYIRENTEKFRKRFGKDPTMLDLYAMHFAGPGGGMRLRKALDATPADSVAKHIEEKSLNANKAALFHKGTGAPKTVGEVYKWFAQRMGEATTLAGGSAAIEESAVAASSATGATSGSADTGATEGTASASDSNSTGASSGGEDGGGSGYAPYASPGKLDLPHVIADAAAAAAGGGGTFSNEQTYGTQAVAAPAAPAEVEAGLKDVKTQSGVTLDGLTAQTKASLVGLNKAFQEKFKRKPTITSGSRSLQKQAELYAKLGPSQAAKPSPTAPHIRGVAIDMNSPDAELADKSGLLTSLGLSRPLKNGKGNVKPEPWHIQQTGAPANPAEISEGSEKEPAEKELEAKPVVSTVAAEVAKGGVPGISADTAATVTASAQGSASNGSVGEGVASINTQAATVTATPYTAADNTTASTVTGTTPDVVTSAIITSNFEKLFSKFDELKTVLSTGLGAEGVLGEIASTAKEQLTKSTSFDVNMPKGSDKDAAPTIAAKPPAQSSGSSGTLPSNVLRTSA